MWTLLAIVATASHLAFKGGTVRKKVYVPDYRFSEDLDFMLLDHISNEELSLRWKPSLPGCATR
jgi:uncharacterized protein